MLSINIDKVVWPLCGEIDILEYVGRPPGEIFTTLHTAAAHGDNGSTKTTPIPDIEDGFHVYAADWTPESITFYVNDQEVFKFAPENKLEEVWPFTSRFIS
ncbi:MAG: glycoside hydrolase family 16 protein [Leeuwenhoekiella sp.]